MAATNNKPASNEPAVNEPEGSTTKDDALDLGVPMLPGDPSEPTGPEDALGVGPKRGDYTGRIGPDNYQPHETVRRSDAKTGEPTVEVQEQRPRADDQGDESGVKGGSHPATA